VEVVDVAQGVPPSVSWSRHRRTWCASI
jgi:hypothetical protein